MVVIVCEEKKIHFLETLFVSLLLKVVLGARVILCTGAHHLEPSTALYFCHGVFTDKSIFSLNLGLGLAN